jgi:hypothetical protein
VARTVSYAALGCAVAAAVAVTMTGGIDTLKEAEAIKGSASEQAGARAGAWLRSHYNGGRVLMESSGNQTATFDSRIPTNRRASGARAACARAPASGVDRSCPPASSRTGTRGRSARDAVPVGGRGWAARTGRSG